MEEFELPQTHIERMDRLQFESQQENMRLRVKEDAATEREKIRHKIARQETWRYFWVGSFLVVVIIGITAAIYFGVRGPNGVDTNHEKYMTCVNNGGSWIPDSRSSEGFCIMQGKEPGKEPVK